MKIECVGTPRLEKSGEYMKLLVDDLYTGICLTERLTNNPNAVLKCFHNLELLDKELILDCLSENAVCEYDLSGAISLKSDTKLVTNNLLIRNFDGEISGGEFGGIDGAYEKIKIVDCEGINLVLNSYSTIDESFAVDNVKGEMIKDKISTMELKGYRVSVKNVVFTESLLGKLDILSRGDISVEDVDFNFRNNGDVLKINASNVKIKGFKVKKEWGYPASVEVEGDFDISGRGDRCRFVVETRSDKVCDTLIKGSLRVKCGDYGGDISMKGTNRITGDITLKDEVNFSINESCLSGEDITLTSESHFSFSDVSFPSDFEVNKCSILDSNISFDEIKDVNNLFLDNIDGKNIRVDGVENLYIKGYDSMSKPIFDGVIFEGAKRIYIDRIGDSSIENCKFTGDNERIIIDGSDIKNSVFVNLEKCDISGSIIEKSYLNGGKIKVKDSGVRNSYLTETLLEDVDNCEGCVLEECEHKHINRMLSVTAYREHVSNVDKIVSSSCGAAIKTENVITRERGYDMEGIEL